MNTLSLETAKKVSELAKEKNIKLPRSEFYTCNDDTACKKYSFAETFNEMMKVNGKFSEKEFDNNFTPAYTTDEIFEILPEIPYRTYDDYIGKRSPILEKLSKYNDKKYMAMYEITREINDKEITEICKADTPSEALGKLLLWVLENDYIKV